jgi:SAM-dependent methyltransferase
MRLFYELGYRYFRMPWEGGPRHELVDVVESGRIAPGRAIDLGSGTGSNAIFLAQHGFDVTGVDFVASAIERARQSAGEAGVAVRFVLDDLTQMRQVEGTFDFLVDHGTLDDLRPKDRDLYLQNLLVLSRPGSQYLLWVHEWPWRWWERLLARLFGGGVAFEPGEAQWRFGEHFKIERIAGSADVDYSRWPPGFAAYLMTRNHVSD